MKECKKQYQKPAIEAVALRIYEFNPLKKQMEIKLSETHKLILPENTVKTGYEINGAFASVYPRVYPDTGMGSFNFPLEFLGELEKKLRKMPGSKISHKKQQIF